MEKPNDSLLVRKYVNGDEKALETLIDRYNSQIFGYIFSKVHDRNTANDIFQDVFIKVILALKKGVYKDEHKFLPWVIRISHNVIVDHFRSKKRMALQYTTGDFDIFSHIPSEQLDAECSHIKNETTQKLVEMIEELPIEQQEVVSMRIYGRMSYNEIAEEKDISINTSLGRMRYALINLRKLVDQYNMELLG